MLRYIARKTTKAVALAIGATFIVYYLMMFMQGDGCMAYRPITYLANQQTVIINQL